MSPTAARAKSERVPVTSLHEVDAAVDVAASVARVLGSHRYILGSEVLRFERAFADFCGVDHCVGVANGTDALEIALRALDVRAVSRVILVANAGYYGSAAVHAVGATPEYVDIDPRSMTMSPSALSAALAARAADAPLAAVIVTHLYGQLAETEALVAIASAHGIPVIEDCAQAHGAARAGVRAGASGAIGCYSFYPTKNLGAVGDGGALITDDGGLATRVRALRQYGWSAKYLVDSPGGRNSRLDEIQAAVLYDRLPYLQAWNLERRRIARDYAAALEGGPLDLPPSLDDDYVAHLYVVRTRERERFRSALADAGVDTEVHYPIPDHLQGAYPRAGREDHLPHTLAACASVVSLPCYPGLHRERQARVIDAIGGFLAASGA
jgi:dTDP-4-amino-4,6-dideoxygalactose transaminase